MTLQIDELIPMIPLQFIIDFGVWMLEDKNYSYSIYRLNNIESELITLYCKITEDVIRP